MIVLPKRYALVAHASIALLRILLHRHRHAHTVYLDMTEALSLLAAVAEHADTLNQDEPSPSRSLRSTVEQTCAADGVASTFAQEAELTSMVCGVVENYIKRTVPSVLAPSGQQQGVVVNLELLLQLATLIVGMVRRDAAVATAVDAAAPGQAAASLTDELQLMDVLVKTLNSQDNYPQQQVQTVTGLDSQVQPPRQQQQQQQNHSNTAFQLLMQHGSSSCLSSDSTLALTPAEAAAAAGVGSKSGRLDPCLSPSSLPAKQVVSKPSAGLVTATSDPLPVGSQADNDIVSVLKQLYYSNDPSAAATAVALAAKLAAGSSSTTPVTPLLKSLPLAQGAAAGTADIVSQDALAALAALQQQQQQQQSLLSAAATDIVQHNSSSLERLNLSSSTGGAHVSGPLHQAHGNSALDPTMLIATMAAAAAAQGDPSVWATALSAMAATAGASTGLTLPNSMAQHAGFPCTTPPPAGADLAAAAAPAGSHERAGKADRYREKRAARASGGGGMKSAGASPTAVASAAAAAGQMRRSASYQAALSDIRHAPHAAGQSQVGAVPMDE